jgi:hypothetical protein
MTEDQSTNTYLEYYRGPLILVDIYKYVLLFCLLKESDTNNLEFCNDLILQ